MVRLGNQEPTFEAVGAYESSRGVEAVAMFESYGRRYYGSQIHEMELFFARDARGRFAGQSIAITKPRQNGKSYAARDYAIWMCFVEHKNVLYSAHHGRTARKMFKEICDFLQTHADFLKRVESIYKAGGYEGIYLKDGHYIEFQTRTTGVRGGTYHVLILDEAQELTDAQHDAILPTLSAADELDEEGRSNTQRIYLGTVPDPSGAGTVFRTMHDNAHAGKSSTWWVEWGITGRSIDDIDIDNVENWYRTNPALGRRMSLESVKGEHDDLTPDGFARERLGWWSPAQMRASHPIDARNWAACATEAKPDKGRTCYAVKFEPSGATVALSAAISDGTSTHVELIARKPLSEGMGWLASWLNQRSRKAVGVVIDGRGYAAMLADKLEYPKNAVVIAKTQTVCDAAAGFQTAVNEKKLTWLKPKGNPEAQQVLCDSAVNAQRRRIGSYGGWGFGGEDAAVVESAALAVWGAQNIKRDPERKQRIG